MLPAGTAIARNWTAGRPTALGFPPEARRLRPPAQPPRRRPPVRRLSHPRPPRAPPLCPRLARLAGRALLPSPTAPPYSDGRPWGTVDRRRHRSPRAGQRPQHHRSREGVPATPRAAKSRISGPTLRLTRSNSKLITPGFSGLRTRKSRGCFFLARTPLRLPAGRSTKMVPRWGWGGPEAPGIHLPASATTLISVGAGAWRQSVRVLERWLRRRHGHLRMGLRPCRITSAPIQTAPPASRRLVGWAPGFRAPASGIAVSHP